MNLPRKWTVLFAVFMTVSIGLVVLPSVLGQDVNYDGYCRDKWGVPAEFRNQNWYCQGRSGILVQSWVREWEQSGGGSGSNQSQNQSSSSSSSSSSTTTTQSDLDFNGYCQNRFGVNAETRNGNWYCQGSGNIIASAWVRTWMDQGGSSSSNSGGSSNTSSSSNNSSSSNSSSCTGNQTYQGQDSPPAGDYVRVDTASLNIRIQPGTDQCILGRVLQGRYYPLYEVRGDWALISGSHGSGWVHTGYVTVVRNPTLPYISPIEIPFEIRTTIDSIADVSDTDRQVIAERTYAIFTTLKDCGIASVYAASAISIGGIAILQGTPPSLAMNAAMGALGPYGAESITQCGLTSFENYLDWVFSIT